MHPCKICFWFLLLKALFWVSESFSQGIGQFLTRKVFFMKIYLSVKTLTHFRTTVETGVGSALANLSTSHPDTDCNLMKVKLSIRPSSPSSISFNDTAIIRNVCPKKFHSSRLFKDLLPSWREFAYDHLLPIESRSTCRQAYHPDYSVTEPKN